MANEYGTGFYGQYIYGGPAAAMVNAVPAVFDLTGGAEDFSTGAEILASPSSIILAGGAEQLQNEISLDVPTSGLAFTAGPATYPGGAATVHQEVNSTKSPLNLLSQEPTPYWNGLFAVPGRLDLSMVEPTRHVYQAAPVPTYTEAQFRERFLDPQVQVTRKVEILMADGETLWNDSYGYKSRLITGSVSVDYDRDERRSIDLELANFDKALAHKPDGFWYDKILRVYRGIQFYDSSGLRSYEVQVGKFLMDRVTYPRFPHTVKITGRDYTKKLLLSKFSAATSFASTVAVEDAIASMAGTAGVHDRILPVTGKTLGVDTLFDRGTSRWEAMKQIATSFGYELFFDANGYLVMREYIDPTLGPISHTFQTGPKVGNLIDWTKSANDTRIFNHVSVIGSDTDSIPVWADAYNNDPNSPTNIDKLGDRVMILEPALVTTFQQAQDLADTMLKIYGLEEFESDLSSLVFPWLEAGEICKFIDPDADPDEPDRYLMTQITVPLDLSSGSVTGRRVLNVS